MAPPDDAPRPANLRIVYYQPPASPGQPAPPLRPASQAWLRNPSYIDGALKEPQLYYTQHELQESHKAALAAAALLSLHDNQAPRVGDNSAPLGDGQAMAVAPRAPTPGPLPEPLQEPIEIPDSPPQPAPHLLCNTEATSTDAVAAHTGPKQTDCDEYLIQVLMHYVEHMRGPPGRGSKVVSKPKTLVKNISAKLAGSTRHDFVHLFLSAHGLADQYGAGPLSGPLFKLYWPGITKSAAGTIEHDKDYSVALSAILSKRRGSRVSVEFNVDDLQGFHTGNKQPFLPDGASPSDADQELMFGTQVPRVDAFPDQTQLHGALILELKELHKCRNHLLEGNEPGSCYKPKGSGLDAHVRLNNHRLKKWAAAVASGDATKWVPPNVEGFDGLRQGDSAGKARGRSGPHSSHVSAPQIDMSQIFMGMAPLLAAMSAGQQFGSAMAAPVAYSPSHIPNTPTHARVQPLVPTSPLPARDQELHQFLVALLAHKDIDLLTSEAALTREDFTPDIMPELTVGQLKAVTGAVDGKLVKMQLFAKEWVRRQDEKRKQL